jgi:hypothetical protein
MYPESVPLQTLRGQSPVSRFSALSLPLVFVAALLFSCTAIAQQSDPVPQIAGPIPPAIGGAKSIFLSNAGADSGLFPEPFSGDPSRGYTELYPELKSAGYNLVDDPAKADLVLELQLTAPYGPTSANKQNGASDPLPMFRLVVYQASTHYVLWALTESIDSAYLQKTHDHNFDLALNHLLADFEEITGHKSPTAP